VLRAVVAVLVLFSWVATMAANNPARKPWAAVSTDSHCVLASLLGDGAGTSSIRLEVTWSRENLYSAAVTLSRSLPSAPWHLDSVSKDARNPVFVGKNHYFMIRGEAGEQIQRELAAGREMELTIESGKSRQTFTSGVNGGEKALREFDRCVAAIKATPRPLPPPPRWITETQGGRDCSLALSGISGVRGLQVRFGAGPKSPSTFGVIADPGLFEDGGVLRLLLPGDPTPFTYDTKARAIARDPRTPALYAAIKSLEPVDMVFTPEGAKPIALRTATEGLAVASPMFDACAAALRQESLPPQYQFNELRYIVSEHEDLCEFTGTYQLDGNAIWLTLVSDGKKNVVKVTRRTVGNGYLIGWLGLEHIGGPKKLVAQDATFELDANEFATLRGDLVRNGRDFHIEMSRDRSYTGQFGGALAVVEAPMFEACAHAKLDKG